MLRFASGVVAGWMDPGGGRECMKGAEVGQR